LAQLATIRLNAARALVSLIDHSHQYILAEATPTLSLGPAGEHRPHGVETLWLGAMVIPRTYGLCQRALQLPFNPKNPRNHVPAVVVNDLLLDNDFDSRCIAAKAPKSRFYASVPLRTDEGACIGALSILDGEPRDGMDAESLTVFQDIANMIMSYLKSSKLRADQTKGDQMLRGLTSFMTCAPTQPDQDDPSPRTEPVLKRDPTLRQSSSITKHEPTNNSSEEAHRTISDQDEPKAYSSDDSNTDADKLREKMLPDSTLAV
jgi:hypothetical protein